MIKSAFILNFFKLYNMLWRLSLPFLRKNRRLAPGFKKRVSAAHHDRADIWIQAASAGEAYLAVRLIKSFSPSNRLKVLVTTITEQGMEILQRDINLGSCPENPEVRIEWFPFDRPDVIETAVRRIRPKVMILLETEIWPALLWHLKQSDTRIFIVNARLSQKSFSVYKRTRFLWKHLAPDTVLATSKQDADRYRILFKHADVRTMNNIKFETLDSDEDTGGTEDKVRQILKGRLPVTILASIRRQEEKQVLAVLKSIMNACPDQVVALFPRHMHRIKAWKKYLQKAGIACRLRTDISGPVETPCVILWDAFGELQQAYRFAHVVFVGGSLVPLGGQNFIEPVLKGAVTVTGPHLDDFAWVGPSIFGKELVTIIKNEESAAEFIISTLGRDVETTRPKRIQAAREYIASHKGGTLSASREILKAFDG